MDPTLIASLLQDNSSQAAGLKRQQALADKMRGLAFQPAQGQMVSGHYVAPSPLAHLMPLMGAVAGEKLGGQADAAGKALDAQGTDARSRYLDALRMGLRKQYPQAGMMLPPDGMEDR